MAHRIAVVGLGNAGFTLHLPALAGIRDATVVGGVDPSPERRERAAAAFNIPVFAAFDDMMAASTPDVVVIGTPPDTHADYCLRCIEAGAHIICEKPFVSSLDEADRVLAAARGAGRHVAVNHEFREMPIFRAVRDRAAAHGGDVTFAQAWQLMDMPPWAEKGWRGQMRQRSLYEAGVHIVDFLMALFHEKPVAVSCSTSAGGLNDSGADAVVLATLEFSRGRFAQIVQNRLCKGEPQYIEVRAELLTESLRASFGGRARVSAGLHRAVRPHVRFDFGVSGIAWREVGSRRFALGRNPKHPNMVATRDVFAETLAAFRDGRKPPTSGDDARDVLAVIAACYHSAACGTRVALADVDALGLSRMQMGAAATT